MTQESRSIYQPEAVPADAVAEFVKRHPGVEVADQFDSLVEELFEVTHPDIPSASPQFPELLTGFRSAYSDPGQWFYYSWRSALVRVLNAEDYAVVRSARNRDLITDDEQKRLAKSSVGVVGLSVGSQVVAALALGARHQLIKIADADVLSLSNMNRLHASITDVGVAKTVLAARSIYELDPYAAIEVYQEGVTEGNLEDFLDGLDVVVDEMDSVALKVRLRLAARTLRIPVVMVTDTGDNGLLDYEPFHLEPDRDIFHGYLSDKEIAQILEGKLERPQWIKMSMKIIDATHAPVRLLRSLPQIGKSVAGVPQLGSSAQLAGAIAAYAVKQVLLGAALKPGKHPIPVEELLLADHHTPTAQAERRELLARVKAMLEGM